MDDTGKKSEGGMGHQTRPDVHQSSVDAMLLASTAGTEVGAAAAVQRVHLSIWMEGYPSGHGKIHMET